MTEPNEAEPGVGLPEDDLKGNDIHPPVYLPETDDDAEVEAPGGDNHEGGAE